jgi:predicted Holliday junction resolvase-like endonuclease
LELFSNYFDLVIVIIVIFIIFFAWNKINTNKMNRHVDEIFLKLREEQAYEKYAKMESDELLKKYQELIKYKNMNSSKDYIKAAEPIIRSEMIEEILSERNINIPTK